MGKRTQQSLTQRENTHRLEHRPTLFTSFEDFMNVSNLPTVQSIFANIDTDHSGQLSRDEVQTMVENAGVGSGDPIFGGTEVSQTVDQFMSYDTDKNGQLSQTEIAQAMAKLFGGSTGTPPPPGSVTQKALGWFSQADTAGDGHVTHDEAAALIKSELDKSNPNDPLSGTKADIAADLLLYNLDTTQSGYITRDEMQSVAQSIDALIDAPA